MQKLITFLSLLHFALIGNLKATNFYVSQLTGNNSNAGTSPAIPFLTLQTAQNLTNPGDTVFVMNGTYSTVVFGRAILEVRRSGTAANPIVYTKLPGHAPLISFSTWNAIIIDGASYIVIDGLRIRGNNSNVTLAAAAVQPGSCGIPGPAQSIYNGNGISIDSLYNTAGTYPHHITVRNMEIFECGGGGINAIGADYITFEDNRVYNNSWYTIYGNSGINIFHSWNSDANTTDYKMIIRRNISYGNRLYVSWGCAGITDGNGIIYDDNRNTQSSSSFRNIPYTGKALIENNICYFNGGRGIHCYLSNNALIRNNTCFQNSRSPEIFEGEVTVINSSNVSVYNNIMYASTGERINTVSGCTSYSQENNLFFNSNTGVIYSTDIIGYNPDFIDTATKNFRLLATSYAVEAGNNSAGNFSAADILGISRPSGSLPDIGAYEFTGTPAPTAETDNFTPGNLVVTRVGDGATALSSNAAATSLIEYNNAGAATGFSVVLANASSTFPNRLLLSGDNASGEGLLSLSSDGRYLTIAGYEGAMGSTPAVYQTTEKVMARVNYNGMVDFSTRILSDLVAAPATATLNRTITSAVTNDGSRIYVAGTFANPASANSTRHLPFGTPSSKVSIAFSTMMRCIKMFKGQVYFAKDNIIGSLTPDASDWGIKVELPGVSLAGYNFQSFVFLDRSPTVSYLSTGYDLLFCADLVHGLVKFYFNGTTWVYGGRVNPLSVTGVAGGLQDITGRINGQGKPELYVVKGAASNNNIIRMVDNSTLSGSIITTPPTVSNVVSAGANYMFRGIAFSPASHTWTGATSTDWNIASNWSGTAGVPTYRSTVVIPNGLTNYPIVLPACTINGGFVAGGANISIATGAVFTCNGAIVDSGSIVVRSSSPSNFGSLINKSSSTISNVTLQQWVAGQRGWRMFANPFTTGQTQTTLSAANAVYFNGPRDCKIYDSNTDAFQFVPSNTTAITTPYALFVRGLASDLIAGGGVGFNYNAGPTPFAFSVTGTLNKSVVTNTPVIAAGHFLLQGNPFAAPIKSQALTGGAAVPYYVWKVIQGVTLAEQRVMAGSWVAQMPDANASIPMLGVAAYQPANTNAYNISSTDIKISGIAATNLFRPVAVEQMEMLLTKEGNFRDKFFISLQPTATANGNDRMDLRKFSNDKTNVYTIVADSIHLAVDARNVLDKNIPLGISTDTGAYSFTVAANSLPLSSQLFLKDKLLNKEILLEQGAVYNFDITADSSTKGEKRFEISILQKPVAPPFVASGFTVKLLGTVVSAQVRIKVEGNQAPVTVVLKDINGRVLSSIESTDTNIEFPTGNIAAGLYIVHITDGKNTVVEKIVKQ